MSDQGSSGAPGTPPTPPTPPPASTPVTPSAGTATGTTGVRGMMAALFNADFSKLLTRQAISLVYVLGMIAIGLVTFAYWITSIVVFAGSDRGLLALLAFFLVPIIGLLYLLFFRITLEFFVIQFRQYEVLREIRDKSDR